MTADLLLFAVIMQIVLVVVLVRIGCVYGRLKSDSVLYFVMRGDTRSRSARCNKSVPFSKIGIFPSYRCPVCAVPRYISVSMFFFGIAD